MAILSVQALLSSVVSNYFSRGRSHTEIAIFKLPTILIRIICCTGHFWFCPYDRNTKSIGKGRPIRLNRVPTLCLGNRGLLLCVDNWERNSPYSISLLVANESIWIAVLTIWIRLWYRHLQPFFFSFLWDGPVTDDLTQWYASILAYIGKFSHLSFQSRHHKEASLMTTWLEASVEDFDEIHACMMEIILSLNDIKYCISISHQDFKWLEMRNGRAITCRGQSGWPLQILESIRSSSAIDQPRSKTPQRSYAGIRIETTWYKSIIKPLMLRTVLIAVRVEYKSFLGYLCQRFKMQENGASFRILVALNHCDAFRTVQLSR